MTDRLPPSDLEAEQATLGAMLIEHGAATRALAIVTGDDFYREAHRVIFAAIRTVYEASEPVDFITVGNCLRGREQLAKVGGGEYLTRLIGEVPTTAHVIRYATILHDLGRMRRIIEQCARTQEAAYKHEGTPQEFLSGHLGALQAIAGDCAADRTARHTSTGMEALIERIEQQRGDHERVGNARTGITALDYPMGGLQDWGMVVARADAKVGKSLFGGQAVLASASALLKDSADSRVVLAYILEALEEWEERALAWIGGFDKRIIERRGRDMTDEEERRYEMALRQYASMPLYRTDRLIEMADIALDVEQHVTAGREPALILVDHFQRVKGIGETATLRYDDAAVELSRLALKYKCPVLVPAQVTVSGDGGRQTMWSRRLDQEATVVFDLEGERDQAERTLKPTLPRKYLPFGELKYFISRNHDARLYDAQTWATLQAHERQATAYGN